MVDLGIRPDVCPERQIVERLYGGIPVILCAPTPYAFYTLDILCYVFRACLIEYEVETSPAALVPGRKCVCIDTVPPADGCVVHFGAEALGSDKSIFYAAEVAACDHCANAVASVFGAAKFAAALNISVPEIAFAAAAASSICFYAYDMTQKGLPACPRSRKVLFSGLEGRGDFSVRTEVDVPFLCDIPLAEALSISLPLALLSGACTARRDEPVAAIVSRYVRELLVKLGIPLAAAAKTLSLSDAATHAALRMNLSVVAGFEMLDTFLEWHVDSANRVSSLEHLICMFEASERPKLPGGGAPLIKFSRGDRCRAAALYKKNLILALELMRSRHAKIAGCYVFRLEEDVGACDLHCLRFVMSSIVRAIGWRRAPIVFTVAVPGGFSVSASVALPPGVCELDDMHERGFVRAAGLRRLLHNLSGRPARRCTGPV